MRNYDKILHLPIDSILSKLYVKDVITLREKETIETLPLKSNKMEYFLISIIIPSLTNNVIVKFERFLEVIEESGDPILINMVKNLGM